MNLSCLHWKARERQLEDPLSLFSVHEGPRWSGFVSQLLLDSSLCSESHNSAVLGWKTRSIIAQTFKLLNIVLKPQLTVWNRNKVLFFSVWMSLNTVMFSVMIHFSESVRFSHRSESLPEVLCLKHFAFDLVRFFFLLYVYLTFKMCYFNTRLFMIPTYHLAR